MGLEAIAAPAVAAAGNMAGGYAASKLMGDTSYPKGGGIQGLTSADAGKSGISPAVQIDPTTALNYFQSAANSYQTNALTGLSVYDQAIQKAGGQVVAGYGLANETLKPLNKAGQAATNQYLKMLGLNAISPTAEIADQVGALGSNYADLSKKIAAAEKIQDPMQRAAAKQDIMTSFQQAQESFSANSSKSKADALAALNPANIDADAASKAGQFYDLDARSGERAKIVNDVVAYQNSLPTSQRSKGFNANDPLNVQAYYKSKLTSDYNNQVAAINKQYGDTTTSDSAQKLMDQYDLNYSENPDYFGYTGDQVNEQLEKTPGYQFSLKQGNQAIERSAAAAGMFNSGNTLHAMDQYSQGLAQQTYGNYMNDLYRMSTQGSAATGQISANQSNAGLNLANLTQSGGQAGLNTYQNIGQALYNSYTNMGNTWNTDMLANMQAQNDMIKQSNSLSANTGIQGGYLNLENQKFANVLAQQAGFGAGVSGGKS
jgi:hypothetical protein